MSMLNRFDMTSNIGINPIPNNLLQNFLFQHDVARNLETLNYDLTILGWFNDEHFTLRGNKICFTHICKLSCDACWNMTTKILRYYNNSLCSTLNLQKGIGVKMDDIYIYHVHTLSLLLACLQNKHRRGRLYFQERKDDVDMNTSDTTTTKCIIRGYIYQVICISNTKIYYLFIRNIITTYPCIIRRYTEDLRRPRVKMRIEDEAGVVILYQSSREIN